jgi:hypothetical protein
MGPESSVYVSRNSVTFSAVLAGQERDRLVGALAALRAELDPREAPQTGAGAPVVQPRARTNHLLGTEEEELVRELGRSLAELAEAAASVHPENAAPAPSATIGAVGGAEMVMRAELMAGRGERLPELLPDFVYLVTLPFADLAGAKALRDRARGLLDEDGPGR